MRAAKTEHAGRGGTACGRSGHAPGARREDGTHRQAHTDVSAANAGTRTLRPVDVARLPGRDATDGGAAPEVQALTRHSAATRGARPPAIASARRWRQARR